MIQDVILDKAHLEIEYDPSHTRMPKVTKISKRLFTGKAKNKWKDPLSEIKCTFGELPILEWFSLLKYY